MVAVKALASINAPASPDFISIQTGMRNCASFGVAGAAHAHARQAKNQSTIRVIRN